MIGRKKFHFSSKFGKKEIKILRKKLKELHFLKLECARLISKTHLHHTTYDAINLVITANLKPKKKIEFLKKKDIFPFFTKMKLLPIFFILLEAYQSPQAPSWRVSNSHSSKHKRKKLADALDRYRSQLEL